MAAGNTYVPLAAQTLGSNTASITFSSISSAYTDLVLIMNVKGSSDVESDIGLRVNSDTGSNYSYTRMYGQSSSAGSDRQSGQTYVNIGRQGSGAFAPNIMNFINYANTTTYKTILNRSGHASTGSTILCNVGLWRSTSAITSITLIQLGAQSYKTDSTFTLYGIAAA